MSRLDIEGLLISGGSDKVAPMNSDKEDTEDTGANVVRKDQTRRTLIATSPLVLIIAGILIANLAVVNMLDNRLSDLRSEQFTQPSELTSKLRALEDKIEALGGQLYRVERIALKVAEEDRPAAPCGNIARDRARHAPHQENVHDGRK